MHRMDLTTLIEQAELARDEDAPLSPSTKAKKQFQNILIALDKRLSSHKLSNHLFSSVLKIRSAQI